MLKRPCHFYNSTGKCRFGKHCKFLHDIDIPPEKSTSERSKDGAVKQEECVLEESNQVTASLEPHRNNSNDGVLNREEKVDFNICRFYAKTRFCRYGNRCRFRHELSSKQTRPLEHESTDEVENKNEGYKQDQVQNEEVQSAKKTEPSKKLCKFFKKGYCRFGKRCSFYHPDRPLNKATADEIPFFSTKTENASEINVKPRTEQASQDQVVQAQAEGGWRQVSRPPKVINVFKTEDVDQEKQKELRETEIRQLKRRFPADNLQIVTESEVNATYVFKFFPTDPDWPFDVKSFDIQVEFGQDYPFKLFTVTVPLDQDLPATVRRYIEVSLQEWTMKKEEDMKKKDIVELLFRPFLRWMDRNMETIVTEGLKQLRRELTAKAAGLQFISASELKKDTDPQASSESENTSEVVTEKDSRRPVAYRKTDNVEEVYEAPAHTSDGEHGSAEDDNREDDDEEEEEEDDSSEEEEAGKEKIHQRPQIDPDTERRGTEMSFRNMQIWYCTTIMVEKLRLTVHCERCKNSTDFVTPPNRVNSVACSKCHNTQLVVFRPVLTHAYSSTFGYLDLDGCTAFDVILQDCHFSLGCVMCSRDILVKSFTAGRVMEICLDPVGDEERKRHKRQNDKLKILLVFGVILLTCLAVVIVFQHFRSYGEMQICTTEECVKGSAYIVNKMDPTVDPCVDFYTFSCGNWEKTTPIPPSKSKYGAFSQISDQIKKVLKTILEDDEKLYKGVKSSAIHKAKTYYDMCMDEKKIDEAGIDPVLKLIDELGSWGLTSGAVPTGTFDPDKWDIEDVLPLSHRYGFGPLFAMSISIDEKNSSRYMINFEQSGLTLSDTKEYFRNHTSYEKLKTAFIKYVTGFAKLLGEDGVETSARDLYDFEQKLAQIHVPREQLLDPLKIYHNMTLQQFQDDYLGNWLNLKSYVRSIFGDIKTIPMDTEVIVYTPEYFVKLQDLLQRTDKTLLANYVVWHSVDGLVGYLTKDFLDVALDLDKTESGIKEYPPRWKRCLGKTSSAFGFAVGALYVQENFAEEHKKEVESLFEEIRAAFIANLNNLEWMDDKTRAYAVEKANGVNKMLGYPDYILSPAKLDEHYENLTQVEGKFFESKLSELLFYRQKNLRRLGTTPDRNEWDMDPTEVNGYYSSDFNHVAFPAGILQPPLFNPTSPKSFNFGSFGMICGHELTHGFDNRGKDFDKEGNMRNWWTKSSTENFEKLTKCFVDFYHEYIVNNTHLNGETTLGENIADNGGMKTAYLAYKSWVKKSGSANTINLPGMKYNPDQLFFIGMAQIWCSHYTPEYEQKAILVDEHSIAKYRVLGSMSNSEYFAKAFNCPKNSPMNPEKKCSVW